MENIETKKKIDTWQLIAGYVIVTLGFIFAAGDLFLNDFFEQKLLTSQIGLISRIIYCAFSILYFFSFDSLYAVSKTISRIMSGSFVFSCILIFFDTLLI